MKHKESVSYRWYSLVRKSHIYHDHLNGWLINHEGNTIHYFGGREIRGYIHSCCGVMKRKYENLKFFPEIEFVIGHGNICGHCEKKFIKHYQKITNG